MSPSMHNRALELHNLAAHAHEAAAVAHGKGDHLTAHELSTQAHEHSTNALKLAEELSKEPDTSTQFAGWSPDGKTLATMSDGDVAVLWVKTTGAVLTVDGGNIAAALR